MYVRENVIKKKNTCSNKFDEMLANDMINWYNIIK